MANRNRLYGNTHRCIHTQSARRSGTARPPRPTRRVPLGSMADHVAAVRQRKAVAA